MNTINLNNRVPEKATKKMPELYSVSETEDGKFEAILPGLLDAKNEEIFGTSKKYFETREDAESAVEKVQKDSQEALERISLEKTFTKYFYRIDKLQNGKYRVTLPGAIEASTGYYVGTTYKDFDSWEEAKNYFLQKKEKEEELTKKPILEIQAGDRERVSFSDLESFNPNVAPAEKAHEIPIVIGKYLLSKEGVNSDSMSTYKKTISEQGWEKRLYSFISSYVEKEGAEIARRLKIKHLESLTPKQAIGLATQLVIDLTKYKNGDIGKEKTRADGSTALEILKEGQSKKNDSSWEGNGVCRNFASSVKAVFEALKSNQTKFSKLHNTYCIYERGTETYAPKRESNAHEFDKSGHAWNTFVTVSKKGSADAVIVDATWAKRNLETKEIEGLDYTLTRMEPIVNAMGREIKENTPNSEEQLSHVLSFYILKMEKLGNTGGHVSVEKEKQFYATRALGLITSQGIPKDLPEALVDIIEQEYLKITDVDISEIKTIYKIMQKGFNLDFSNILKNYLKNKELSNHHASNMIFKDDNLQRLVFEELKADRDFDKFLRESSKFRVRMREALPQLFMEFSPTETEADAKELRHLVNNSRILIQPIKNKIKKPTGASHRWSVRGEWG